MELVARHRISSGKKGERKFIEPGQRFNTDDFSDVSEKEWTAMLAQGTITRPEEPSYAAVTGLQRAAAAAPVPEGRSPRADVGEGAPPQPQTGVMPGTDEDDDDDEDAPRRGRRGRRRSAEDNEEL